MFQRFVKNANMMKFVFFFDKIYSRFQCGFRKGINTKDIILAMIEKMKTSRDNKQYYSAILTDLSKAFDRIRYELLPSKHSS